MNQLSDRREGIAQTGMVSVHHAGPHSKCQLIIFSARGGVDIEEVAKTEPEAIVKVAVNPFLGIQDYTVSYIVDKSSIGKSMRGS